jgi:PAS domain S-box-containing protein
MRVLWGPEFILLYNDSYRPILGKSKHPTAMASRTAESFREVWDIVGPLFHRVYAGEAIALEDSLLPLERNGYLEECYFTLSYSPILDDGGKIGGLLGVVHETTAQVVGARRLAILRELAAVASSAVGSPELACERAAAVLARSPDVPFALFYVLEADGVHLRLVGRTGLERHPTAAPAHIELEGRDDHGWPFARATEGRGPFVVTDVQDRFGDLTSGAYPEPIHTALLVPLRLGTGRLYGFFVAGVSPRRALGDAYRGFFELVSEQIGGAASEAVDRQDRERLVALERATDARLRLLFNEAPAAIALLRGPVLTFELANPLYCQLVGRTELLGHPGRDVLPELVEQGIWDIFDRVYATGEPFVGREFPAKLDRNGSDDLELGYFNVIVQPTRDLEGRIEGIMVFAIEITELVLARQSAESGRAERTRLLASEQTARADAERSNQAKDEFLAIVSHELRNPLSAMLGWTRLLRGGTLPPEKSARALETIERNAVNQSQLIEDLLDVSRIISGKLRLDVRLLSFVDVVRAAIDSARPALDAKQIRLKAVLDSEAHSLMGDAARLQQIVWNLLSNATKFTPKGGSIQVVLKRVESAVELTVADSGSGIAAAFLPHIFDRFRQADPSTTRTHGGLGVGLSITKNLVEMHGGTIIAESEGEGRGAAFVLRLPVAPLRESPPPDVRSPPRERAPAQWTCPPELAGLRILVVDDEPDARALVAEVLEQCGALVVRAGSAHAAIEAMDISRPDVILSDIGMPEEDGYALIRKIRNRPKERGGVTPAASLTAYAAELVAVVASLGRMARALA